MWLIECVCCAVCVCGASLVLQAGDRAFQTLLQVQQRDGQLRLNHFRRVKQLGAGDVGLVDLVQLQVRGSFVMMGWDMRASVALAAHLSPRICSNRDCVAVVMW